MRIELIQPDAVRPLLRLEWPENVYLADVPDAVAHGAGLILLTVDASGEPAAMFVEPRGDGQAVAVITGEAVRAHGPEVYSDPLVRNALAIASALLVVAPEGVPAARADEWQAYVESVRRRGARVLTGRLEGGAPTLH